ncbi:unnamed protein product [Clavelina lepadiformis]|uniref:MD-2-related lipid-recognition domain-containing protein n=1 Tax=Clavelina lepadiformis TaxID=159417 RepID=A0ABP0GVX3_CLALP
MSLGKFNLKCKGLPTCLLTTAFLFCFGLLALYKYTLIDPDAVLLQVDQYDYDDYGIDVSALRTSTSSEGDEMTSQVEKWDEKVREDGGLRISYITDHCDEPTNVYGVAYLSKSELGGLKVVVLVNYTAETQIDKGTAEAVIHAMFGKALVLNQTLELCSVDEEMLSCPVEKGFRSFRREVTLPRFAPKGRYHGIVHLRYTSSKEEKLCGKGRMIL